VGRERGLAGPIHADEFYDPKELLHGAKLSVPFKGKGGKITHWNAIYVDPSHYKRASCYNRQICSTQEQD